VDLNPQAIQTDLVLHAEGSFPFMSAGNSPWSWYSATLILCTRAEKARAPSHWAG